MTDLPDLHSRARTNPLELVFQIVKLAVHALRFTTYRTCTCAHV
jgi:hypothetical protein